jgi:SAM-dependent methyltransferase
VRLRDRIDPVLLDLAGRRWDRRFGARVRGPVLARARGRVLEIGVGAGGTIPHYPARVEDLVVTDPSPWMLRRARGRAAEAGRELIVVQASAEALPFDAGEFDQVVSFSVLCSVPDQAAALAEVVRVLRPGGELLFYEHVRSDDPERAVWQDRLERPWGLIAGGCHPNRPTLEAIESSGLELAELERGETPGVPRLVRPYVSGRAIAPRAGGIWR